MTVKVWRRRYAERNLAGLGDEACSGRPPVFKREDRDWVIALTLSSPPAGLTHGSARRLGREVGMSDYRLAHLASPIRTAS